MWCGAWRPAPAPTALAGELGLRQKLLNPWCDAFRRGGPAALRGVGRPRKTPLTSGSLPAGGRSADPLASAQERIAALERKVGQQQLELDFFTPPGRPVAQICLTCAPESVTFAAEISGFAAVLRPDSAVKPPASRKTMSPQRLTHRAHPVA
jgi:hypothetical protein